MGSTPVMIDCEDTGDRPTVTDCLTFAAGIRNRGGVCTLVYLPRWYWQDHLGSPGLTPLTQAGLGLVSSNYTTYSDTGPGWNAYGGAGPVIWQYTASQPYAGRRVDFNAYRGTVAELRALVSGSPGGRAPIVSGRGGVLYHVTGDGTLRWYRHLDPGGGAANWANGGVARTVGTGWNGFPAVLGAGGGVVYAVQPDGDLLWYRHTDPQGGATGWAANSGATIGNGWQTFRTIASGDDGILYGVAANGDLTWYRHTDPQGGGGTFQGPRVVGSGWSGFGAVIGAGGGVLYVIGANGDLFWYRHLDPQDGAATWANNGVGRKIGTGWAGFRAVVAGGDGVLYAEQPNGDLLWYRHTDPQNGGESWAAGSGTRIGSGWA